MSSNLITLVHWNAKAIGIGEGRSAGMIPIAPPGDGIVPAGFKQEESLEWSVSFENFSYLLEHYDLYLKSREGRIYGYFNDKGDGFQKPWIR